MVPAVTMQIEKIPLNQNQKVNKKELPKPEKKRQKKLLSQKMKSSKRYLIVLQMHLVILRLA